MTWADDTGMHPAHDVVMRNLLKRSGFMAPLVIAAAMVGCTADDEPSMSAELGVSAPPATEERVMVRDLAFEPAELTVAPGTTVTWVNEDEQGHTVTHGEGGAPATDAEFDAPLSAEQTVSYTFEEAGTYPVTCKVHTDMQMTVIVEVP